MDKPLPFITHLGALRKTLLVCIFSLLAATALCMPIVPRMLEVLRAPAAGVISTLFYFGPEEALLVYMRVGFFCGLIISFPVISLCVWHFLAPAFSRSFQRLTALFVSASFFFFVLGCLFGYKILLPPALRFLLSVGGDRLQPLISASRYISLVTGMMLACGVVFLMPVIAFFLARAGLVSAGFLRRRYPVAIVGIFIVAAVITPTTDVFNLLVVAGPMIALYEVSIWIAFFFGKNNGPSAPESPYGEVV
jgi:sec-independent protein translocase protein TatC